MNTFEQVRQEEWGKGAGAGRKTEKHSEEEQMSLGAFTSIGRSEINTVIFLGRN